MFSDRGVVVGNVIGEKGNQVWGILTGILNLA